MINFEFKYLSGLHRVIELYMIPYLHFWTYFLQKKKLIFCIIFCILLYLFCGKLFSPSEIISTNDKHIFIRILVTNLRILCFVIFAIPTICTPYYQSRLNLNSRNLPFEHTHLFGMRRHLYFSRNNLLRVLTYVWRHCNVKCF